MHQIIWRSALSAIGALLLYGFSCIDNQTRDLWSIGKNQGGVHVIDVSQGMHWLPSAEEFFNEYVKARDGLGVPVLLKGAAKRMPAFQKWQSDKEIGILYRQEKLDQIETEKLETRTKYPYEDWDVAKFIESYEKQDVYSISETPEKMRNDVWLVPVFNCGGYTKKFGETHLWWSSGGTESVVHSDNWHNHVCMFGGSKNWILWHPASEIKRRDMGWVNAEEEYKVYGNEQFKDAYGSFAGKIKIRDMETTLKHYPKWNYLHWWNMTLEAGDCAYVPIHWFHFVESPAQRSISVNIFFHVPNDFEDSSCTALIDKGYDIKQWLFTLGDCTFGYTSDKPSMCKLSMGARALQTPKSNKREGHKSGQGKERVVAMNASSVKVLQDKEEEKEAKDPPSLIQPGPDTKFVPKAAADAARALVVKKRKSDVQANMQNKKARDEERGKGETKASRKKPRAHVFKLLSQTSHDVVGFFAVVLISLFVGSRVTYTMLRSCDGAQSA